VEAERERRLTQLGGDVDSIYGLLEKLDTSIFELRGMIRRQGNRLDSVEGNVAQLQEDVGELKADMAAVRSDVAELKGSVAQILALLQPGV
jgi:archaellum component FlaC